MPEHGHGRGWRDIEPPAQWILALRVAQFPEPFYRRLFGVTYRPHISRMLPRRECAVYLA